MNFEETHEFLVEGADFKECHHKVHRFFERTVLVKYDVVHVEEENSLPADNADFFARIEAGIMENRKIAAGMVQELRESGFKDLDDLVRMNQGYESKILHTLTHLLDGFFGIDSFFYNLAEDSHLLSDQLREKIAGQRKGYWLLRVHTASEMSANLVPKLRAQANQPD